MRQANAGMFDNVSLVGPLPMFNVLNESKTNGLFTGKSFIFILRFYFDLSYLLDIRFLKGLVPLTHRHLWKI